jgi:hypothetical protein
VDFSSILVLLLPLPPTFVTLRTYKPHKQGCMQIPVEPNLDKPIPVQAQPQTGRTYEDRLKVAGNTAMLLKELGAEDDLPPEEKEKARQMIEKLKPADAAPSLPSEEEKELKNYNVALAIGSYLNEYEKQIVADKVQVRTVVVNRLMEISKNEDDKIALKALELLGKASDLFTERSEITITHKTSDELKAAIKDRIAQLMQMQKIEHKTKTENRLSQLKHTQEAVDVEVKEVK